MSVTGEFIADFNDFVRGAKTAEAELNNLEKSAGSMGAAFEKSTANFSIEKAFTSPMQTAKGVVTDFTGELGAMGIAAGGAVIGIAAVGSAVLHMANSAADTAERLGDLHDKTGLEVTELSRLSNAAKLADSDIGAVSDVIWKMQQRMGEDPGKFNEGLKLLNINAKEFISLSLNDQFEAVARGMANQADSGKRIAAGMDLIGKSSKDLIPVLVDLGSWALDTSDHVGKVFTQEEADAAENYHKQIKVMKGEMQGLSDTIGSAVVPKMSFFLELLNDTVTRLRGIKETIKWPEPPPGFNQYKKDLDDLNGSLNLANDIKRRNAELTKEEATRNAEAAKAQREYQAELDKFNAAWVEINAAGTSWRDTLASIDSVTQEMIREQVRAGVSDKSIIDGLKIKAIELRAVKTEMSELAKAEDDKAKTEREVALATQKLYQEFYKTKIDAGTDATQKAIDNIWAEYNANASALELTGRATKEQIDLMVAIAKQREANYRAEHEENDNKLSDNEKLKIEIDKLFEPTRKIQKALEDSETQMVRSAAARGYSTELVDAALKSEELSRSTLDTTGKLAKMAAVLDAAHAAENAQTYTLPGSGLEQVDKFGSKYLVDSATGGRLISQQLERVQGGAGGFLGWGLPQGVTMRGLQIQLNGLLMSSDPAARQQLSDVISRTVTDTLKSQGVRLGA